MRIESACSRPSRTSYSPDRVERRRMSKVVARERKAARVRSDQGVLHETGIRSLRRKPVFHTPNVFPTVSVVDGFEARDVHQTHVRILESRIPNPENSSIATSVSRRTRRSIDFYDQLCPACAALNFTKRTRAGGSSRARRAADWRSRQDRLSNWTEAASMRCAADRDHSIPTRCSDSLRE